MLLTPTGQATRAAQGPDVYLPDVYKAPVSSLFSGKESNNVRPPGALFLLPSDHATSENGTVDWFPARTTNHELSCISIQGPMTPNPAYTYGVLSDICQGSRDLWPKSRDFSTHPNRSLVGTLPFCNSYLPVVRVLID